MYSLLVFQAGETSPRAKLAIESSADVLPAIEEALRGSPDVDHIVAMLGATRLFSVTGEGLRQP